MKNFLFSTLTLAALAIPAHASTITISLVDPNQIAAVGQTIEYYGVLTNNTGSTVNLDGDDLILNAPGITLTDDFNNNVPFSLAPDGQTGSSSGVIELFDVTLSSGFSGTNLGTYDIVGDTGGNASVVGNTTFSVAQTPEPASIFLLLTGLPVALLPLRKRLRRS
jgi:hypothetical protein